MNITWVTRSFLDYRIPVYAELDNLIGGKLKLIYYRSVVPERVRIKANRILGGRAIGMDGEIRLIGKRNQSAEMANSSIRLPYQPDLTRTLLQSKPDVIVSDGFFQWTCTALRVRATRCIPHVMCYERTAHNERNAQWFRIMYRKFVMRWIDSICCSGQLCGEYVQSLGFPSERITYGHMVADVNGMRRNATDVTDSDMSSVMKKHQLRGLVFLNVGRMVPLKGISQLLNAWHRFSAQVGETEVSLLLVGDGPQRIELEEHVHTLNLKNVYFAGHIDYDQLTPYYKCAHAFIIPTLEDNWSLVVPEAMASGLPILCSKYNGCWPEYVQESNGWVFDPLNATDTVNCLRKCLAAKAQLPAMGRASYQLVCRHTAAQAARAVLQAGEIALHRKRQREFIRFRPMKARWFFLKYSLVKPKALSTFNEAIYNQSLPREELDALNWKRTKSLLEYAYKHVPYYTETFSRLKLDPYDIRAPEHFYQVPVLTREELQENVERLISREAHPGDLKVSTTGGSTGEPVKVYHEKQVVRSAMLWRVLDWWDLPPDVNRASIYRDVSSDWKMAFLNKLFWWPTKVVHLDASAIDEASIETFLNRITKMRPQLIHAYVGALDHVVGYMLENKIRVPAPKVIWTTCSPLTSLQEHRIRQAFNAPVFDHYGCCEVYWLAAQCPSKKGLHMFQDVVRIEFLNENNTPVPTGQFGSVAITDLQNRYFPLIRYLNNDRGRGLSESCSCGRTLPLMDKVKGRVSDNLRLPDGTIVSGEYLTTLFDEEPEVAHRFQVVQRRDYSVDIVVVPNVLYQAHTQVLEKVRSKLADQLNNAIPVRTKVVASIPSQKGKLHFVKSELSTQS